MPELSFNDGDDSLCRDNLSDIHKRVQSVYSNALKNQARLDKSYQEILDFGVSLVDNSAFLDWTTADWKESWSFKEGRDTERPGLSKEMDRMFTTKINKDQMIDTLADMEEAMAVLFRFRANIGLESEIAFRRRVLRIAGIPESEYAMCSSETKALGDRIVEVYYANVGDTRPANYYPMLDNLNEWMEETYSN